MGVINSILSTSLLLAYKRAGFRVDASERTKFYTRMNSVSLLVVLSALAASAAGDEVARKPKLFVVSTSSTTTTLQTASLCYATSGTTIGTCTGRKRRSINIEGVSLADVKPSQLNREVQSSQEDQLDREGRFLLYWITTTSVSTSTSFTTTVSISGKVICTTSGIVGVNVCGK